MLDKLQAERELAKRRAYSQPKRLRLFLMAAGIAFVCGVLAAAMIWSALVLPGLVQRLEASVGFVFCLGTALLYTLFAWVRYRDWRWAGGLARSK